MKPHLRGRTLVSNLASKFGVYPFLVGTPSFGWKPEGQTVAVLEAPQLGDKPL